jgi:hypothetical protein
MSENETERRIATLEARHDNIEGWLKRIDEKVERLLTAENERHGASHAMKVLWGVSVAGISLATTWITLWLRSGGHT